MAAKTSRKRAFYMETRTRLLFYKRVAVDRAVHAQTAIERKRASMQSHGGEPKQNGAAQVSCSC